MRIEVKVPQLPESVAEATLVSWHKKPGDAVARDENLIDVETDKVVLELPAPGDGVLVEIVKADGSTVTSNEVIAVIDTEAKGAAAAPAAAAAAQPQDIGGLPAIQVGLEGSEDGFERALRVHLGRVVRDSGEAVGEIEVDAPPRIVAGRGDDPPVLEQRDVHHAGTGPEADLGGGADDPACDDLGAGRRQPGLGAGIVPEKAHPFVQPVHEPFGRGFNEDQAPGRVLNRADGDAVRSGRLRAVTAEVLDPDQHHR